MIDCKKLSEQIINNLKNQIDHLTLGLAIVMVGDNTSSQSYVKNKIRMMDKVGIKTFYYKLDNDVTEKDVITLIKNLNIDKNVNGILVQLPLPSHLPSTIINFIDPSKDVDGLTPHNLGLLALGSPHLVPCTSQAIVIILKSLYLTLSGKNIVIVGRSNLVSKPLFNLLLKEDATVTITHSKTINLQSITINADILIVAIGQPSFIKKEWVKPGASVIDVGINYVNNKIVGDVDQNVKDVTEYVTPVPGGVGPMTIACLIINILKTIN